MQEKILTLHPQGKQGVNVSTQKYDAIRDAIVDSLRFSGELTFTGLMNDVRRKLEGKFEGSIDWYVTTVKLDLEARNVIERVPGRKPQHLRLASQEVPRN